MASTQSVYTTRRGEFRRIHRALSRHPELRAETPVVFCEGDSWFSTPLAMNILDWLVFPTPEDEARGVPVFGRGGLFFRAEHSGDLATGMFAPRRLADIMGWYGAFDFDVALLSAGGNDFVGPFLAVLFAGRPPMTVAQAFRLVVDSGRYDAVYQAYERALSEMVRLQPGTTVVAHTYCYPLKLGAPAGLTLANIGLVALLKRDVGPWIGPSLATALPSPDDQRLFARAMIDGLVDRVLAPLAADPRFRDNFRYLDLRALAPAEDDWFDEMHPTGATFHRLSVPFAAEIRTLFAQRRR